MTADISTSAPAERRMTTGEAARYTGVAESTLRYYRHADAGPASYKVGTRVVYDVADLDAWLAAHNAQSVRGGVQ